MRLVDSDDLDASSGIAQRHPHRGKTLPFEHRQPGDSSGLREAQVFDVLFGGSQVTEQIGRQIRRVAPTNATVLITGESGTGKEVAARTIHRLSPRGRKPFVPVNCGAISPLLIESELFGHEKGSFTGALKDHRGVFEQADGGTLFLDEITEMPIELQVKLLRVLESHRFMRVGGDREQFTDVRIIAATNRNLEEEVESGNLREDLLYRLRVFPVEVPALRYRGEDIPGLARFFLKQLNQESQQPKYLADETVAILREYAWPGNLRELRNVIQRAHIMADTKLTPDTLPAEVRNSGGVRRSNGHTLKVTVGSSMEDVERDLILATLEQCGGRREQTANILGVSMKTLYNRLRKYGAGESLS